MNSHAQDPLPLPCPYCPVCSGPPMYDWPQMTPWLCINVDCEVFAWDPYSSLEVNLMDARPLQVQTTAKRVERNLTQAVNDDRWVPCLYDPDVECQHIACQDMEPRP